jgi:UDP-glucose 4-epimerase
LSNSKISTIFKIQSIVNKKFVFIKNNLDSVVILSKILSKHKIQIVFHLAGLKSVEGSILNPLEYFKNNFKNTLNLLEAMKLSGVNKLIFSSSATIYGNPKSVPVTERSKINPSNPYGLSKVLSEFSIEQYCNVTKKIKAICLRYFNPVGYHFSGKLKESHKSLNLFPQILKALIKNKIFKIFGNKYKTKDGTAIRDYIHIQDLINAHIQSISFLKKNKGYHYFNIGMGKGYTVLEVLRKFEIILNKKINFLFVKKRKGDVPCIYTSSTKAKKILNWKPRFQLKDMIKSSLV